MKFHKNVAIKIRSYHYSASLGLIENGSGRDPFEQIPTATILQNDMQKIVIFVNIEKPDDIGVTGDELHKLGLIAEAEAVDGVVLDAALLDRLHGEAVPGDGGVAGRNDAVFAPPDFVAHGVVSL